MVVVVVVPPAHPSPVRMTMKMKKDVLFVPAASLPVWRISFCGCSASFSDYSSRNNHVTTTRRTAMGAVDCWDGGWGIAPAPGRSTSPSNVSRSCIKTSGRHPLCSAKKKYKARRHLRKRALRSARSRLPGYDEYHGSMVVRRTLWL
jgi:hypothetical protein